MGRGCGHGRGYGQGRGRVRGQGKGGGGAEARVMAGAGAGTGGRQTKGRGSETRAWAGAGARAAARAGDGGRRQGMKRERGRGRGGGGRPRGQELGQGRRTDCVKSLQWGPINARREDNGKKHNGDPSMSICPMGFCATIGPNAPSDKFSAILINNNNFSALNLSDGAFGPIVALKRIGQMFD